MKFVSAILDLFNPGDWAFKLLIAGILAGSSVWAWQGFKHWVSAPIVAKAEAAVHAAYIPQFNALTTQFKDIEKNIIDSRKAAKDKADAAVTEEQDRADKATENYKRELRAKKQLATERDSLVAGNTELLSRMRDASRPLAARDGDSAEVGRLREFGDRLGRLYDQCEQGLARVRSVAAAAIDRASAAEAAARALKPE